MDLKNTDWKAGEYRDFLLCLESLGEEKYKKFSSSLIPGDTKMFGIRIPTVRKIAKEILKTNPEKYLMAKKGDIHEEVIIEGLVLSGRKSEYTKMLEDMKYFSTRIYNWANCDSITFKGVKNHREKFIKDVDWFLENPNPWAKRMGILHLMNFYLDSDYIDIALEKVESVKSEFYYVEMMQAWFLATAFAKGREKTLLSLERGNFSDRVMNMAVRKIRESLRISREDKELVLKFKR